MSEDYRVFDTGFSSALGYWDDEEGDDLAGSWIDVDSMRDLGAPLLAPKGARSMLANAARLRPTMSLQQRSPATAAFVSRLRDASRVVLAKNAEVEAFLARQPNALAGVVGSVAAAASPAVVITPGGSNRDFELVYFAASDETINNFACTAFSIGADNLLQGTSTLAGAANNSVSLAVFSTRNPGSLNPQGWAGKTYLAQNTVNFSVTNVSAAAAILSVTVGLKIDPCSDRAPRIARRVTAKGALAALRPFS